MTVCQIKVIQGQEVKKVKCYVLGLGGVMHVVGQIFVKNAKKDPRAFLNGSNRTNFENQKHAELPKSS